MIRSALLFGVTAAALLLGPTAAGAQTEGRVGVGGSITLVNPSDDDVRSVAQVGPLVRLNPGPGLGVAAALNWFRVDLREPEGRGGDFARLRVRPLMAGIGYTVGPERTLVNFSVVVGPSFNGVDFEEGFAGRVATATQPAMATIDVNNSFAVRPGISVTQTLAPRVGLTGFGGYMFNRPDVVYRSADGIVFSDRWSADALVLSVGLVYSIF